MKGQKKVHIAGKEVSLRFDLNALEQFTEATQTGLADIDGALDKPKNIKMFIQCLAESGGSKISLDEIGSLDFTQLAEIFALVKESAGNLTAPEKGA